MRTVDRICGSRTCKPNSVRRIAPAGRSFLWATHRCEALATYPKVGRTEPARPRPFSPECLCYNTPARMGGVPSYLVLLRVGFALPAALLPRRCAFTAPFHPYPAHSRQSILRSKLQPEWAGRYVFCGTFRRTGLNPPSRTLSGTLLCGVRTFLSPRPALSSEDAESDRPVQLPTKSLYAMWGPRASDLGLQTCADADRKAPIHRIRC